MTNKKRETGFWGEELAAQYLCDKGYQIIGRNVRTKYGELDIIAKCQGAVVFIEVKTRLSDGYGFPEESVTRSKKMHIIRSAQAYLQDHPVILSETRIDVIAISQINPGKPPQIVHYENAITDV